MKKTQSIGFQLIFFFVIAMLVPTILLTVGAISTTTSANNTNMKITSEQTLNETQKGFTTYLKTLSQPVDLLTRKNEIKHLEDRGTFDDNVKSIQDSLVASVKVTSGAEQAFFTTNTGYRIEGWTGINEQTGKVSNKSDLKTGVNETNKIWYTSCKGLPSRNGIYAYISDPYYDSVSGKTIITVTQEIKYTSGENYGTVGMNIDFTELTDYVQNIGLLNTGYVILVNNDGDIIVNNDKNQYVDGSVKNLEFWKSITQLPEDQYDIAQSYDEKINGEKVHIVASKDAVTGWTLVGFISSSETASVINKITNSVVVSAIVALVIGIIIALFVTRMFSKEIKKVNVAMGMVAEGDLTNKIVVKKKNEFGVLEQNFNHMVDNISVLIKGVEEKSGIIINASDNIAGISRTTTETINQVSEAIQSVSTGAVGQADSTKQATGEVNNLADRLHETKNYVTSINDMSIEAKNLSNKGIDIVEDLINKGKKSMENSKISKSVVEEMINSIEKINFISDAITEITEQTNLLSLNASIEAARAGESGRGFAVVADEIRKLAEQSQSSTDEIKKIVGEITDKSQVVEQSMDESVDIINQQNSSIEDTRELFNNISNSVNQLTDGLNNISKLNDEMDSSKETVVASMDNVDYVATETAAAAEEVTASVEEVNATMHSLNECTIELDEIATSLKEAINKFKL